MALSQQFKIKNDLNVLGRILSGGNDIASIVSTAASNAATAAANSATVSLTFTTGNTATSFQVSNSSTTTFTPGNGIAITASSPRTLTFALSSNVDNINIGQTTPGTGKFTNLTAAQTASANTVSLGNSTNGTINIYSGGTVGSIDNINIGNTAPAIGKFTDISSTGNATFNNATVNGTLYIQGTATTVNTSTLTISNPVIYLNEASYNNTKDVGIVANYVGNAGTGELSAWYAHAGLLRANNTATTGSSATPGVWYLFSNMVTEPSANSVAANTKTVDTLVANLQGNASTATAVANVPANSIVGNSSATTGSSNTIAYTSTGIGVLTATNAANAATVLGLGTTNTPVFNGVQIGSSQSSSNFVYYQSMGTAQTSTTINTILTSAALTVKYIASIQNTTGVGSVSANTTCAAEILATRNYDNSWDGVVYGIIEPQSSMLDYTTEAITLSTVGNFLALKFNFNASYKANILVQATTLAY